MQVKAACQIHKIAHFYYNYGRIFLLNGTDSYQVDIMP